MADNITALANTGSGTDVFATDDIGGVNYPRTKVGFGDDGSYVDASAANPMPVQEVGGAMSLLTRVVNLLMSPMGFDRSLSRQRVTGIIESGTVTTVTTVTTLTNIGASRTGVELQDNIVSVRASSNLTAWAQCVRSRIS
jgi:hypothetical protein